MVSDSILPIHILLMSSSARMFSLKQTKVIHKIENPNKKLLLFLLLFWRVMETNGVNNKVFINLFHLLIDFFQKLLRFNRVASFTATWIWILVFICAVVSVVLLSVGILVFAAAWVATWATLHRGSQVDFILYKTTGRVTVLFH